MLIMISFRTQAANLVPQILPNFVAQRALYEARERSAKTYSWKVFILSNILVEIPWNTLMSVLIFASWYFPVGLYRNSATTILMAENSGMIMLLMWAYMSKWFSYDAYCSFNPF